MNLNELWFVLIMVLFSGYFFLEGFDYGVGMLVPVLGKSDLERRFILQSIGPVWDANEVWLVTAAGAMFAAFPGWYSTLFSGFYPVFFLLLLSLIGRGVGLELRGRHENRGWKKAWDFCIPACSLLPPLLFGIVFTNLIKGIPIDAGRQFAGSFFGLLSLPALFAGVTAVSVFLYHGAVFLTLKVNGPLLGKAFGFARYSGLVSLFLAVITAMMFAVETDVYSKPLSIILTVSAISVLAVSYVLILRGKSGVSLALNGIAVLGAVAAIFTGLFPRVMVSSLQADYSLTIYNTASSPYTLSVMSIAALTVLPVVIGYTIWTYRVFRKRLQVRDLEY